MNNLGCLFLEEGINFDLNMVSDCCIMHNDGRGLPILLENYHGELIDWEKLFDIKAKRVAKQKEKTIYDCEGCYRLAEYTFTGERKISNFHFSHCRLCNAKCIYCSEEYSGTNINYNTYPVIKDLIEKGYYKAGGEATFQGGEPTLMHNFDELVHLFTEHGTIVRIHTSGIKYSNTVEEALRQNKGTVVISLDSGCRETYKKIKQVDSFNKVCETIERYSNANPDNIIIKYILIPGINDNIKEIDKFFKLMKEYGIKTVALDIEVKYAMKYENKNVSEHVYLLVDYFEQLAEKLSINMLTYSFLSYVLKNREIKKRPLIKNKFVYGLYVRKHNDKSKNLIYRR
ncbi:MAG: radical SAM protein [Candidatus Gastranaerophilales bacterium]|nr:radical SAM protein [Candidatus Gastranaerophilales bacterium]